MRAKVSIIVPVYNTEEWLERCLDTLVNQTLQDIEILVVNDGSTDGSQAIIDSYAEQHPHKVVSLIKPNGGLSDARNFGVARATGEYLGFVDSDDWVDLDAYQRLHDRAAGTDADVVFHPITYAFATKYVRRSFSNKAREFGRPVAEWPNVLIYANSYAWNKIYRRDFWLRGGYEFPVGQAFEDSALIYNVLYAANKVEYVNVPFYFYERTREQSITNATDRRIYDIFKSCTSILSFYRAQPDYDRLKNSVEYVCLKHLFLRFNLLAASDDRAFVREFLVAAYAFLDEHIPDWQQNFYFDRKKMAKLNTKAVRFIRAKPRLATAYYTSPRALRAAPRELGRSKRSVSAALKARRAKVRSAGIDQIRSLKTSTLQESGLQMLVAVQTLLKRAGIESFADFGTLLGLVREGRLLRHDVDLDLGVVAASEVDAHRARIAMERFGFKVWREYRMDGTTVEASFRMMGVKVDLNYYRVDENRSRTWLFYRDPNKTYGPRDRDIVEMVYSPIGALVPLEVEGAQVMVPANAEELLAQKYGNGWRTPDTDWVYWQSPAATAIDVPGRYVAYQYPGGFARPIDPDNDALYERLYRREVIESHRAGGNLAELRQLQLLELTILHEVDRVCREQGLTYYLGEGTLLGAIRHGGFIPWDDDIDIVMPRPDYEKFLQIAPTVIEPRFEVQHWTLIENYWSAFAKVRLLDNSVFYQPPIAHLTPNNGPYLDIFPIDSVPAATSPEQNHQKVLLTRYRKALSYKRGDTRPKTRATKLVRARTYFYPIRELYRRIDATYRMLEAPDNDYWVNLASYYPAARETFPRDYYGAPRHVQFEDGEFPVPAASEAMLERIYGPDYLRLPDIESRKIKHAMTYRAKGTDTE